MKKGFISITVIYSFLIVFIFTLLSLLLLYTQKSRLVDSVVLEAKEQIYNKNGISNNYSAYFEYLDSYQTYTAPATGYYYIQAYGAQGGQFSDSQPAGKGGYTSGYIYLNKNDKLYIYIGAEGKHEKATSNPGGYNGGGYSGTYTSSTTTFNGGGGGATDIRYFGSTTPNSSDLLWNSTLGLNSRIMVAGGGGGAGNSPSYNIYGGSGGTLTGGTGLSTSTTFGTSTYQPTGGSQIEGGKNTKGNFIGEFGYSNQASLSSNLYGGGGGSGYYGGTQGYGSGGSGGSSFISGYGGVNAITSSSNRTHTNNTLHYSGKYFLSGVMRRGVNSGNGKVTITYVESLPRINTELNNVRYIKDCINGNSANTGNYWIEIQAIKDGTNIALNKNVTATSSVITSWGTGMLSSIVDGDLNSNNYVQISSGSQCVTVDLGSIYNLDEIAVWHYYNNERVYYNNVTSVSSNNTTWTKVMDETVPESVNGKRISAYSEPQNGYVQDGLLLYYDGISNTGKSRSTTATTWTDLSGNGKDGTLIGGTTWTNNSLSLDGSDGGVSLGNALSDLFKSSNTVQITLKRNENSARDILLGNYNVANGINYEVYSDNKYRIYFNSGAYNGYVSKSPYNQKYVVTFGLNRSNNLLKIFNNSSYEVGISNSEFGSYNYNFNTAYLGRDYRTGVTCLNGEIYSFRVYNRLLTDEEIYHNYFVDKDRFGLQ